MIITCNDGFTFSLVVERFAYCFPRVDKKNLKGLKYQEVEIGYPNDIPPEYMLEYAEDKYALCETVYAYVPASLVKRIINDHAGTAIKLPNYIDWKFSG